MKKFILLFFLIAALITEAQTSCYQYTYLNKYGRGVAGQLIQILPYGNTYPTGAITVPDVSGTPGLYEKCTIADGDYDVYLNGSKKFQKVWIGAERQTTIADNYETNFDGSNKLIYGALSQAVKDSIAKAGTVDNVTIEKVSGVQQVKEGGIQGEHIADGEVGMPELSQTVKDGLVGDGSGRLPDGVTLQVTVNGTDTTYSLHDDYKAKIDAIVNIIDYYPTAIKSSAPGSATESQSTSALNNANNAVKTAGGEIVLPRGTYSLNANVTIDSLVHLRGDGVGTKISVASGYTLTIKGSFENVVFDTTGNVDLSDAKIEAATPEMFGYISGNYAHTQINKAFESGAKKIKLLPYATYLVKDTIEVASNTIFEGDNSIIKTDTSISSSLGYIVLVKGAQNVTIRGIEINNLANYPNDLTIARTSGTYKSIAGIGILGSSDVTIENCKINGATWAGLFIRPNGSTNSKRCKIINNRFQNAGYFFTVMPVWGSVSLPFANDTTDSYGHIITGNTITRSHVYKNLKPGFEDVASVDGIALDVVRNSIVSNNIISEVAGIGIRIEESQSVSVTANTISNVGQEGITFYNSSFDCVAIGNTINKFGRIPGMISVREYPENSGVWYYPTVEHYPSDGHPQPYTPGDSAFVEFPYFVTGDTANIPVYDRTEMYDGVHYLLPFRGYSGISVTALSQRIMIIGNTIIGDTSKTGTKYNYASDYAISIGNHSVNSSFSSDAGYCVVLGNSAYSIRNYNKQIFAPKYEDSLSVSVLKGINYSSKIYHNNASVYNKFKTHHYEDTLTVYNDLFLGSGKTRIRVVGDSLYILNNYNQNVLVMSMASTDAQMSFPLSKKIGFGTQTPNWDYEFFSDTQADVYIHTNDETAGKIAALRFGTVNSATTRAKGAIFFEADGTGNGRGKMRFAVDGAADGGDASTSDVGMTLDGLRNLVIGTLSVGANSQKVLGISAGNAPTTAPADMIQLWVSDSSAGNAELYVMDEAGHVTQLSEHASDAPEWFYDSDDRVGKTYNIFTGIITYTNYDRDQRLSQLERLKKPLPKDSLQLITIYTETFIEYNTRTGQHLQRTTWESNQQWNLQQREKQIAEYEADSLKFVKEKSDFEKVWNAKREKRRMSNSGERVIINELNEIESREPKFEQQRPAKFKKKDMPKALKRALKKINAN